MHFMASEEENQVSDNLTEGITEKIVPEEDRADSETMGQSQSALLRPLDKKTSDRNKSMQHPNDVSALMKEDIIDNASIRGMESHNNRETGRIANTTSPRPVEQGQKNYNEEEKNTTRSPDLPVADKQEESRQAKTKQHLEPVRESLLMPRRETEAKHLVSQPSFSTIETGNLTAKWDPLDVEVISIIQKPEDPGVIAKSDWGEWPRWRVQKRPRLSHRGWFEVQTTTPPLLTRDKRAELRKLHKELKTKHNTVIQKAHYETQQRQPPSTPRKNGTYQVELMSKPMKTRLLGFFEGKLRFMGKTGDPRIVKGWFRKKFDIVCAVDGQSIERRSREFIQNLLSNPEGKTTLTLTVRPFENPPCLPPVPNVTDEGDEITIESDVESLEDSVVVLDSPNKSLAESFMDEYDDDDGTSDDDSYERELKFRKSSGSKGKPSLDDASSIASDESEFVLDDAEEANDDQELEVFAEDTKLPHPVAGGTTAPPKANPHQNTAQATPAGGARIATSVAGQRNTNRLYDQQMHLGNTRNMSTGAQNAMRHTFGQNPGLSQNQGQSVIQNISGVNGDVGTFSCYGASTYGRNGEYTAVMPVFPDGLRILVWEVAGKLVFFGYQPGHPSPYSQQGFRKVGDAVIGIEGNPVEHLKAWEVCELLRRHCIGKQQLVLQIRQQ